jgi:hypothetical protein
MIPRFQYSFGTIKTLTRNETTSSLGTRVIGDEREEVIMANDTPTMLTRFVSNGNYVRDLLSVDNNVNLCTYRPKDRINDNSCSFTNFKLNEFGQEVKYMSERVGNHHKFELHKA